MNSPAFSHLSRTAPSEALLRLLNDFESQFGNPRINRSAGWEQRLRDRYCSDDTVERDVLLARAQDSYAGLQGYCCRGSTAYTEGLYVREAYRGQGLGPQLRSELLARLRERGVTCLYIGKDFGWSTNIRRSRCAQSVARGDLMRYDCVEMEFCPDGLVKSYGILL